MPLVELPKALQSLIAGTMTLLGLILMATPLALWVAWSETILFGVLATGFAAGVLYCVLARFEEPGRPAKGKPGADRRPMALPDEALEDLRGLHPYIHHHRPTGSPEFRSVMRRLYGSPD